MGARTVRFMLYFYFKMDTEARDYPETKNLCTPSNPAL